MDPKLNKWLRWFAVVHDEIQQLIIAKDIFWSIQDLVKANPQIQKPSAFYTYLGDTYISHVLIGIRRQIKVDPQAISIVRLLMEIADTPQVLSREYFTSLYAGSVVQDLADEEFDRFCEAGGGPHISTVMIQNDLNTIRQTTAKCEEFADRRIAHRDTRDPRTPPTFKEVDDVVDTLDQIYVKYHLVFHAGAMVSLMPTYQYDWQEIFDERWRPPFEE